MDLEWATNRKLECWQDIECTIPAVKDGDQVAVWRMAGDESLVYVSPTLSYPTFGIEPDGTPYVLFEEGVHIATTTKPLSAQTVAK